MIRMLALPLLLAVPAVAWAADPQPFPPLSVTLPQSDSLYPGGASADAINNNCLACHSVEMVQMQPPLGRAGWTAEVAKMRGTYHAPVDDADVPAIIAYLVARDAAAQPPTSSPTQSK
ncbi:c-type cytochrome [Acidisphaera rubrifaciens]|uniref:Sulfite:cytochrome c oxidoreductase subunit B n=1 Tax=Acidisphaera rubrifaciens HS-AP3 TaxID=1231350 RepID=A0A0D6P2G3_9PROT|nr:cytochrome c [Acidisphaera rubrifaciens]GAN75950.1 hypothetical protein Asru_0030_02 [Acidisphaera rubrifaciens HS-AP3]